MTTTGHRTIICPYSPIIRRLPVVIIVTLLALAFQVKVATFILTAMLLFDTTKRLSIELVH